jgi:hypothetical protein
VNPSGVCRLTGANPGGGREPVTQTGKVKPLTYSRLSPARRITQARIRDGMNKRKKRKNPLFLLKNEKE